MIDLLVYMAMGQKRVPKKPYWLKDVKGNINPATCGPRLGFLFDPKKYRLIGIGFLLLGGPLCS